MCVLSKSQLYQTTVMYREKLRELLASGISFDDAKIQAATLIQAYRRELLSAKKRRLNK